MTWLMVNNLKKKRNKNKRPEICKKKLGLLSLSTAFSKKILWYEKYLVDEIIIIAHCKMLIHFQCTGILMF